MTNESKGKQGGEGRGFDLEERTAMFGEAVIDFLKTVRCTDITGPLVRQLVRSGTSVGANYCEANDAGSTKEFRHRLGICRREAKESKHWLRMIARADTTRSAAARPLWKEAQELNLIFSSILKKSKP
ncbi:MAG: four helix bundle protein [Phycisphaerales bacterium]